MAASNEQQAEGVRKQIEERKDFLPKETTFVAIPDRDGKCIGSGGATLEVLKYLHEQEDSFDNLRILVIHSGGDSKRVPQYSAMYIHWCQALLNFRQSIVSTVKK